MRRQLSFSLSTLKSWSAKPPSARQLTPCRVKKAKEKKARRAKTIKQLDSMGRRHLLGVRIVMKNWVYVVGVKVPGTGDEVCSSSSAIVLPLNAHTIGNLDAETA